MFKIIITIILLCSCATTQAQSLSNLFKSLSSSSTTEETKTPAPKLHPTSLTGNWNFTKLAVALADNSALKGFAGDAMVKQVENLLNATSSSAGISEGMFTITFKNGNHAIVTFKDSKKAVNSNYSINTENNTISIEIGKIDNIEVGVLSADVKLTDEHTTTLLIDAKMLIAIADQIPSLAEDSQYKMVRGVATSIDGLLIGFTVQKL